MSDENEIYELTEDDRRAALWQAEQIAKSFLSTDYVFVTQDGFANAAAHELLVAKIEAAIGAEMVMRGRPLAERDSRHCKIIRET